MAVLELQTTALRQLADALDEYALDSQIPTDRGNFVEGKLPLNLAADYPVFDDIRSINEDDELFGLQFKIWLYGYDQTQQSSKTVTNTDGSSVQNSFAYDVQGRMETVTITYRDQTGTPTRIEETTYDYDATGIRVSAEQQIDSDGEEVCLHAAGEQVKQGQTRFVDRPTWLWRTDDGTQHDAPQCHRRGSCPGSSVGARAANR